MWAPDQVVQHYKRRAVALWLFLVLSILTYTAWLIYEGVEKRKHPGITFIASDDLYKFPNVSVCLFKKYGCDTKGLEQKCVMSNGDTEGGPTKAAFRRDEDNAQELKIRADRSKTKGWCVMFAASDVEIPVGSNQDPSDPWDYIKFDMYWYPGGTPNSTTCGMGEDDWESHSGTAHIYLNDSKTGILSTGIQVPYSCMTNASSGHIYNAVNIGLTETHTLDGSVNSSYKMLSTSSIMYNDKRDINITGIQRPYAYLQFEIAQGPHSLEIITEIDPLDIANIFGNIGGFWDFLRVFWPVFFVVTVRQDPFLKSRDFKKTVLKATKAVANTITSSAATSRVSSSTTSTVKEARPPWEGSGGSAGDQQGGGVLIRSFDDHDLVVVINGAPVKKFLESQFNAKLLKSGATEAPLLKLLPPNTYLITVRAGSTTRSIATAIVVRCRVGGDAVDNFNTKPVAVKAKRANLSLTQSQALSASRYVDGVDVIREESNMDLEEEKLGSMVLPAVSRRSPRSGPSLDAQSINSESLLSASVRHPIPSDLPRAHA